MEMLGGLCVGRAVCWGFVLCKKSVSDDETHTYAMVTFI